MNVSEMKVFTIGLLVFIGKDLEDNSIEKLYTVSYDMTKSSLDRLHKIENTVHKIKSWGGSRMHKNTEEIKPSRS